MKRRLQVSENDRKMLIVRSSILTGKRTEKLQNCRNSENVNYPCYPNIVIDSLEISAQIRRSKSFFSDKCHILNFTYITFALHFSSGGCIEQKYALSAFLSHISI